MSIDCEYCLQPYGEKHRCMGSDLAKESAMWKNAYEREKKSANACRTDASRNGELAESLRAEVARLESAFRVTTFDLAVAEEKIARLKSQVDVAKECLRFFAEPFTWSRVMADAAHVFHQTTNPLLNNMYGQKAREALATLDPRKDG